jgi:flagellar basal body rod protein FlgF
MIYKVFNSYGGFSLKNEDLEVSYKDIENIPVKTIDGQEGFVRIVGSTHVYEHGYSANEDIYKIVTLDYKVINIPSELIVEGVYNLMFSKIHEAEKPPFISNLVGGILEVNGKDGVFKYNITEDK